MCDTSRTADEPPLEGRECVELGVAINAWHAESNNSTDDFGGPSW